jgi:hypothetical protein
MRLLQKSTTRISDIIIIIIIIIIIMENCFHQVISTLHKAVHIGVYLRDAAIFGGILIGEDANANAP